MKKIIILTFLALLVSNKIYLQDGGTIGSSQTFCFGGTPQALTFTISPNLNGGFLSYYEWEVKESSGDWIPAGSSGPSVTSFQPSSNSGFRLYRVVAYIATGGSPQPYYSNAIPVNITPKFTSLGTIGTATTSPHCYNSPSEDITFKILPTVSPAGTVEIWYQWKKTEEGSSSPVIIEDANNSSINPGSLTKTSTFTCNVYSRQSYGVCNTGYSNEITIVVHPQFSAGSISSNQSICPGTSPDDLIFSTSPVVDGETYIWQESSDNSSWADKPSSNSTTYNPGILTVARYYRCKILTGCGSALYTNSVLISMLENLSPGVINSNQTICHSTSPDPITFTVSPTPANVSFTYAWFKKEGASWSSISGANTSTLNPGNLTTTTKYRCEIGNPLGNCGNVITNEVTITVRPPFSSGEIGIDQTICPNTAPNDISITSPFIFVGDVTINWQEKTGSANWETKIHSNPEIFNPGNLAETKQYRCLVGTLCGDYSSNIVTITIPDAISPGTIGNDQVICYNTHPEILNNTSTPKNGLPPYVYEWRYSYDTLNWTSIEMSEDATLEYQPDKLTKSTCYKRVVADNCSSDTSNFVTVTVKDKLADPLTDIEQYYCKDSKVTISLTNALNNVQWYNQEKEEILTGNNLVIDNLTEDSQFFIVMTDEDDCATDTLELNVKVDPIMANFSVSPAMVEVNSLAQFTSKSINAIDFLWDFDDGTTTTDENPQYIYHELGPKDISLTVNSAIGCEDTETKIAVINVIEPGNALEINSIENIDLYPVPVNDLLTIKTEELSSVQITIFSITGKRMLDKQLQINDNSIDVSSLLPGLYLAKIIKNEHQIIIRKFTKK